MTKLYPASLAKFGLAKTLSDFGMHLTLDTLEKYTIRDEYRALKAKYTAQQ
ncbi:MAG: hypothetical protein KGJ13_11870 [Patescibacteria group bacterium]|nr:hypothetical protein [Patescibacteria group bacterium]